MEEKARCIKCGRVLRSSASIARGMGSTCAGTVAAGKSFNLRMRGGSAKSYATAGANRVQKTTAYCDSSNKPASKREEFRRARDERRKLFEARMPFQCGVLARTSTPLIYVPLGDSRWKENHSGRIILHDKLQHYLKRFRLI